MPTAARVRSPLPEPAGDIVFFVVREKPVFSDRGRAMFASIEREAVIEDTVMSRIGLDSIRRFVPLPLGDLLARFLLSIPGRQIVRREQTDGRQRLFVLAVRTRIQINQGH